MAAKSTTKADTVRTSPEILILFPDDWAAYSPTLTRLTALLCESFKVRVHVIDIGRMDSASLDPHIYRRVRIPSEFARLVRKLALYRVVRTMALAWSARRDATNASHVIAVDADGACAARILGEKFHFLSLEIGWHPILRCLVRKHAVSITTQSIERLNFQFKRNAIAKVPVFIVQNAPSLAAHQPIRNRACVVNPNSPRFVYLGHSLPLHGLLPMLELVKSWPTATLTLQGIHPPQSLRLIHERYGELLRHGRVKIGLGYVPEPDLDRFLSDFDIGLCLYELDWHHRRNFNYLSSPAGKMFNYFSSGLPVLASNQVGLNPVSLHRAGIQVSSNSVEELRTAARTILANYDTYRAACINAAVHYDFKISANRLVDFLRAGVTTP